MLLVSNANRDQFIGITKSQHRIDDGFAAEANHYRVE